MNFGRFADVFPLGSHLCREPMPPMSELKKDMENLKKHGFNLIKIQEQWAADEPVEGQYDFSRCEELIEYADQLDMGVYLGLTLEQAPAWLWRKHPDCRMVGSNGVPIAHQAQTPVPSDGKPGPCFDHPGALADHNRFIEQVVRTLGKYENIVVWNTWQEIGYWGEALVGQPVCYCENTFTSFRVWLREKYDDLDNLNKTWNTRYGDWQDIFPHRVIGSKSKACVLNCEWDYFINNVKIARTLEIRANIIRLADALKRPIFAHKAEAQIASGEDWVYAICQDYLGSSSYPGSRAFGEWDDGRPSQQSHMDCHTALTGEMWNAIVLPFDYIRSANKKESPFWAAEFQGGPISDGIRRGRTPSSADIRRWMLCAVGSGVTSISFWVTRAEIMAGEGNGYGILDSEGDSSERFEEASRVGIALNKHPDIFAHSNLAPSEVGILVNDSNYRLMKQFPKAAEHLVFSTRGWHRQLWEAGVSSDFVEVSHLDDISINNYKILILPFPLSLSESVMNTLAKYVEVGGCLISEACPGRFDENAFCNRGELSPAAAKLFGVRHTDLLMMREPNNGSRWTEPDLTWGDSTDVEMIQGSGLLNGLSLQPNVYLETFECIDSEPCLKYGDLCVGSQKKVGKGQAWIIGTVVGHNGLAYRNQESIEFINQLLFKCNVVSANRDGLLVRKRISIKKEAWIFTNPTNTKITTQIDAGKWSMVEDLLDIPLEFMNKKVILEVFPLDIRVLIVQRG